MSNATFKAALRRRAGSDRPERKPLPALLPPPAREYQEPTDEQLARFMAVTTWGAGYPNWVETGARAALGDPTTRALWIAAHRSFQQRPASLGTDPQTEPSREDGGRKP